MHSGVAQAYSNNFKGTKADPLYLEYLAMGGGKTSAYTADKSLEANIRKKLSGDKSNWINPLEWIDFMADMVELGPRYSYYRLCRNKGLSPQEAFYESTDITVNFRRGGVNSRSLNKIIPFFNAGVQGLDKFARWISANEVPKETRAKAARNRGIAFFTVSVVLGFLQWAVNSIDDDKEKDYAQLSNYTKNTYWCIPLGGGKYFAIPKPRELAVVSSFTQAMIEQFVSKDPHAFDEFWDYTAEQIFPNAVSDLAKGDWQSAIGSLGVLGVGAYMMANRDFLGRPIVSQGMQYLEPKDRYNARTSKIAYWLGQAFNQSPQMIDFFFQQTLGGWWKTQKALFPVGKENVDYTLGVQNQYVKDNQYSTDVINRLYDAGEEASQHKKSNPTDVEAAITAKWYGSMTDFYSAFNKLSKESNSNETRAARQIVLDMIVEFEKNMENEYSTDAQKAVERVCMTAGDTSLMPSVMNAYVKDDNRRTRELSATEYLNFQTEYNTLYWQYVEGSGNLTEKILKAAKDKALTDAKANALYRLGFRSEAYDENKEMKSVGLTDTEWIKYQANIDAADDDGSLIQAEVIDAILSVKGLSDEERSYLFRTRYDSDKNNPWA